MEGCPALYTGQLTQLALCSGNLMYKLDGNMPKNTTT